VGTVIDLDVHLASIAAGDTDAFARWLAGAERPIRESLRSFAAVADTEAVLQETLLRAWQIAPRVVSDGRANTLLRLSVRMARNLAISAARKLKREVPPGDDFEERIGDAPINAPDPLLRRTIEGCRQELPEKPKLALGARIESMGGEGDAELASRLHMRTNTFLQNVTRARKLLAECLRRHGVDLEAELA
jgi:DNA-directed RNA polymerase specialized sigma24 family protein